MAKHARRKPHHGAPRGDVRPKASSRVDPPDVVAVRALGAELRDWQSGGRGHGAAPASLALTARIGPELLAAHGIEAPEPLVDALAELVATLAGQERPLRAVRAVLDALDESRARDYLRGVVAVEAGD